MITNNKLAFVLDNKIIEINFNESNQLTPTTTLLQYLRSLPNHKGVKEGCAEGDCGACTVVIAEKTKNHLSYKAVNSCLVLLPMVHGKQVITVENLGTSNHLHEVQKAIVEYDGSQCGFCTPGIVMSLFSYYKNETNFQKEIVNDYLAGNLCRCTGYKSILNAAENISLNKTDIFRKEENKIFNLLNEIITNKILKISKNGQVYFKVYNLADALELLKNNPKATIINGSTDVALQITKQKKKIPLIIDINDVKELSILKETSDKLIIGAGVKLNKIKNEISNNYEAIKSMLSVFGSKQIRNLATIGGNISSASPIGDILPVLIAYNSKLKLKSKENERIVSAKNFVTSYRKTVLKSKELIIEIIIPKPKNNTIVKAYKISKRKELDISSVSGGFMVHLNAHNQVENLCLVYGGMAEMTKRAEKTENLLKNKEWNKENIEKAMQALEDDFTPISDARSGAKARMIMAKNLLLKFWSETCNGSEE